MRKLICQQCQAALEWDGVSEVVRCAYCGTVYQMHPRQPGGGVRVGAGAVAPIATSSGRYAGLALVKSYIPKGWKVTTNSPEVQPHLLTPLAVQVQYDAPEGDAVLTYTGTRAYEHLDPTPQNAQYQDRVVDHIHRLAYRDAPTLCDGIVQANPAVSDPRLLSSADRPDAFAEAKARKILAGYTQGGNTCGTGCSWVRRHYTVRAQDGTTWHKQLEALVTYLDIPPTQEEQMLYQMALQTQARAFGGGMAMGGMMGGLGAGLLGGLLGRMGQNRGPMGGMGGMPIQPPQPKRRWAVDFLLETSAREEAFDRAAQAHNKIRESFAPLPILERESGRILEALLLQARQEAAVVNNAMSQMARDQMASWDRKRDIIQGASDYGTQVMHDMQASNARTHDRVNNLWSEAIRGVNTYYGTDPATGGPAVVEADTRWDYVYQNSRDPNLFAASTGDAPLEFGVDYDILWKTDGNY